MRRLFPTFRRGGLLLMISAFLALAYGGRAADRAFRAADFAGKNVGLVTGTLHAAVLAKAAPGAIPVFYAAKRDAYKALEQGKVVGVVDNAVSAAKNKRGSPGIVLLSPAMMDEEVSMVVRKGNVALRRELNEFIRILKTDGTYDDMVRRWLHERDTPPMPDIPTPGDKGTLRFASAGTTDGISYYQDEEPTGFDIEFAKRFAQWTGRDLEMQTVDFGELLPAVAAGNLDFAASFITVTPERAEIIDFTDPYFQTGCVMSVYDPAERRAAGRDAAFVFRPEDFAGKRMSMQTGTVVDTRFSASFVQNILHGNRWKILLNGLFVTLLISIAALVLGTVLGFGVCALNMSPHPALRALGTLYVTLLRGMPVVVLLMIIYYIVFASVNLNSILVAVVAFGLNAGASIGEMLRSALLTVDQGQIEAARGMGFSRAGAFLAVTLPQAVRVALPGYKSEFVSLVKSTAVVGYIAIIDLTRAGDLIRSRTYDAFFPLIAVALLYLALTSLVVWGFDRINLMTDKRARRDRQ